MHDASTKSGPGVLPGNRFASVAISHLDEYVLSLDLAREARELHLRAVRVLAAQHVEGPAVPRTRQLRPVELAEPHRSAEVRARVVDGVEGALHVHDRELLSA